MRQARVALCVVVLLLASAPALAHVPQFAGDNTSPDSPQVVTDATKSWSFYDHLDPGQVRYYRLQLNAGEQLRVSTFTPDDSDFTPSVALLSSRISENDLVPGLKIPPGLNASVVEGSRPDTPNYEPFAPSANYHTASMERTVQSDGSYLIAVYEPANRSGQVGIAIGSREEFSPVEYLRVPFDLLQTRLWEGQHPAVVFGPLLVTVLGGMALLRREFEELDERGVRYVLGLGGVLVGASALNTALQMVLTLPKTGLVPGAVVTAMFVVVPALCSLWILGVSRRETLDLTPGTRAGLAIATTLSLLSWAGFLVGPVVLLGIALLPARYVDPSSSGL